MKWRVELSLVRCRPRPELADLLAALITVVAVIGLLSFWRSSSEWHFERHLTPAPEFRPSG